MSELNPGQDGSQVIRYERLSRGRFYADFRRDKRLVPEIYHCIIQREGSAEILRWTQHRTLEDATTTADVELNRLAIEEDAQVSEPPMQAT
jgi:hypothetical protein